MSIVTTKQQLGEAVKRRDSEIIIEGELARGVIRIKATGAIAWALAAASLATAVGLYLATPVATVTTAPVGGAGGGVLFGAGTVAAGTAAGVIGLNAVTVAIGVAIAAGGFGAVTALRNQYKIKEKADNRLVLEKK
jgi:hypothetical protein